MTDGYIVVYDDRDCLCIPMQHDPDLEGGLISFGDEPVAIFESRADARRAIQITAAHAHLHKLLGKHFNEDALGAFRKNLRVLPLKSYKVGVTK
jgi:hypothetical protein